MISYDAGRTMRTRIANIDCGTTSICERSSALYSVKTVASSSFKLCVRLARKISETLE